MLEDWAGQRRLLKVRRGSGVSAVRTCRCVTLLCLQDLRDLLVDLSGGPREDSAAAVKVEDLIVLVEDMLENASKDPEQVCRSACGSALVRASGSHSALFSRSSGTPPPTL